MDNNQYHTSVMLRESMDLLNIDPSGHYIDCTLGEAGHSKEILRQLKDGSLSSYDRDLEAIEFVKQNYSDLLENKNWELIHDNFSNLSRHHLVNSIDGILMDIGMSSRQLDALKRGFSFKSEDDPLDMRMDTRLGVKAADLINALDERQLTRLFSEYGEEKFSRRIASAIKNANKKIESVKDLTEVIDREVPVTHSRTKTYRRIFQALRIVVNDELDSLKTALEESLKLLKSGGRLVVITFHSLEDRIVKDFFKNCANEKTGIIIVRAQEPSEDETIGNKRAHSAKMSVLEKA